MSDGLYLRSKVIDNYLRETTNLVPKKRQQLIWNMTEDEIIRYSDYIFGKDEVGISQLLYRSKFFLPPVTDHL